MALKIDFYYVTLRKTFLDRQNQCSGLTKIDRILIRFEICLGNLAVTRRNELSLGL